MLYPMRKTGSHAEPEAPAAAAAVAQQVEQDHAPAPAHDAARLGVGGLGAVGAAGVLQPLQVHPVLGVVGVQLHGAAGILQRVDAVAQALIGQRGKIVPPGIAGGHAVQHAACLGVAAIHHKVAGCLHLGRITAAVAGTALLAVAVEPKAEPEGVKTIEAVKPVVLLAVALLGAAIALLTVAAIGIAAHLGAGLALGDGIVGGLHLLEVLLGGGVVGVQIGVPALAFGAVCFFDLFVACAALNAQHLIRISHGYTSSRLISRGRNAAQYSIVYRIVVEKSSGCFGIPAGTLCIVAVVLQPYAGIQDVAQQVGVLHAGQALKTFGTACQQQLKNFPHLFLVAGLLAHGFEGIVGTLPLVAGQIVVGVHQIDELAQMEAQTAQLRRPVVLLVVEQFGHQLAKAAGHGVQVLAAGGFVFCKPGQTAADGGTLPGPAGFGVGAAAGQQFFIAEAQQVVVILPFVLGVVVMQRHAQVGTVVGGAAGPPVHAV